MPRDVSHQADRVNAEVKQMKTTAYEKRFDLKMSEWPGRRRQKKRVRVVLLELGKQGS